MKYFKHTVFLLASLFTLDINATHIVGGEMTYQYLGTSQYEITLKIYRDCGPDNVNMTGFDDPAYIGIYADNNWQQTLSIPLATATVTQIPYGIENPCLVLPPDVCIEECIYIITATLPLNVTGYDLVYVRCCRSPAIINLNIPEDQGMTCHTHVPGSAETTGSNSSAVFTNIPPSLFCADHQFTMDHSATDLDGDSLSYEFCLPLHGADAFNPQPTPLATWVPIGVTWATGYNDPYPIESSPAFSIDPVTGWLTGTPTLAGKFVYAICATEWRDGVPINAIKRDYMIQVLPCATVFIAAIPVIEPCIGMTIDFVNNSISANDFWWDFGVEEIETDTTSLFEPEYTFADPGLYTITLIAEPGATCSDTATQTIAVYPPLDGEISLTDSYCEDGQMFFDFDLSGSYDNEATFFWDFPAGANPASATLENPTPFGLSTAGIANAQVTIVNHNCELDLVQQIDVPILPVVSIGVGSEPCSGYIISFENNSENCQSGSWDFGLPGNGDTSTALEPVFTYPEYGTFTATYTCADANGCSDSQSIEVWVSDENPLELTYNVNEPLVCAGDSAFVFQFTGAGITSLWWDLGDGGTDTTEQVIYTYDEEDSYLVTLTIYNEVCDVTETTVFEVEYGDFIPDLDLRMPNIISTNSDNKNERLRPFDPHEDELLIDGKTVFDLLDFFSLKVYDRWGVLMYESTNKTGWDGHFNGDDVSAGVYYYLVEYRILCHTETISHEGYVHVVRDKN
ncbi:MAG: PKD domain-containing protein [Flavobacteriales bacterium]|nr:PKD domain-containing protein [Flavobacteriales bacterium]